MKQKLKLGHYLLFVVECSALVAIVLSISVWPKTTTVAHEAPWIATVLIALGVGMVAAVMLLGLLTREERGCVDGAVTRSAGLWLLFAGCALSAVGGWFAIVTFPDLLRSSRVATAEDRWCDFSAIDVRFDASGGSCPDLQRIIRKDRTYGEVLNVFSGEDERRMKLHLAKLDLRDGWVSADRSNESATGEFINYFTSNAVPCQMLGGKWTYVVEMGEMEGSFSSWAVGQTAMTNENVYAQLTRGFVNPSIKSGERQFLILNSTKWGEKCNMLDRAYIHLKPGQHLKAKFRVSLFAGTGVNASNYHYVKPGETIACPLPVPTREGYEFEGWYDGERRVTETTKVEKRETHTLTARWRKM